MTLKFLSKKKDNLWFKLIVSLSWDTLDFFVGRIPVFGTVFDITGGFLSYKLWGTIGIGSFWEVLDITDQLDGFIPTLTLIGLIKYFKEKIR